MFRIALPAHISGSYPASTASCPGATGMHSRVHAKHAGGCKAAANAHYSRDQLCNLLYRMSPWTSYKNLLSNKIDEADLSRDREWME